MSIIWFCFLRNSPEDSVKFRKFSKRFSKLKTNHVYLSLGLELKEFIWKVLFGFSLRGYALPLA